MWNVCSASTKLDDLFNGDAIPSIAIALMKNKHLTELHISGNDFDIATDGVFLPPALHFNGTLIVLSFHKEISEISNSSTVAHQINAKLKENREYPPNELRSRFVTKIRDAADTRFVFN
jgi:hypothetical protein